jgi:putative serine/threonine protein kinase
LSLKAKTISINDLLREPYNLLLSYPKVDNLRVNRILNKLKDVDLEDVIIQGETQIDGLQVLGKGCTAVVLSAKTKYGISAIKILRTDADRKTLKDEGAFLNKVNILGIGPKLYYAADEFLVMELVEGKKIGDYINNLKGRGKAEKLRRILEEMLMQCFILDENKIAHCELSNPVKHIIISSNDKPIILDFESANSNKKYSNVTALAQSLFVGGQLSLKVRKTLAIKDIEPIIVTLKEYKHNPKKETFEKVLKNLRIKFKQDDNKI